MTREEEKSKAWNEYANRISLYTLDHEPFTITDVENAYKAGYQKVISASQWHKAEDEYPAMDDCEAHKGHLISYKVIVTDGKDMYMGRFDLLNHVWLVPDKEDIVVSYWTYLPNLPETEDRV